MKFRIIDAEQRSPEWFAARLGRLTGSVAGDMLATIKSGEAAARRDLRLKLVCERLTASLQEDAFVNAAMQRGIECEPLAFAAYEARTGQMVQRVGFVQSTDVLAGCSPDGYVGDFEGLIECKCPKSATHLKYLKAGSVPSEHIAQITHNLWVTGAQWCDFVSYDDRFPESLHLFIARVDRDEAVIQRYADQALAFLAEVETECAAVRSMSNVSAVLADVLEAR